MSIVHLWHGLCSLSLAWLWNVNASRPERLVGDITYTGEARAGDRGHPARNSDKGGCKPFAESTLNEPLGLAVGPRSTVAREIGAFPELGALTDECRRSIKRSRYRSGPRGTGFHGGRSKR